MIEIFMNYIQVAWYNSQQIVTVEKKVHDIYENYWTAI